MEITFQGLRGNKYVIESTPFACGGEGNIYRIVGSTDILAKIYIKTELIQLHEKIKFMVNRPIADTFLSSIAWPVDILYGTTGSFCGYVMPKCNITHELSEIYVYPNKLKIAYQQKLVLALNICSVINEIHKLGYILGDFNPRNIGLNINTGEVAFFDTDSYHIVLNKDTNQAYRCNVCAPGYAAPELLEKCAYHVSTHPEDRQSACEKTPLDTFTVETDNFSLAIHMFRLLMNGYTPFNGINENESASVGSPGVGDNAVRKDSYCFKPGNKPQAIAVPDISVLPEDVAELFTRAFIDGRRDPKKRPDAIAWHRALKKYEKNLVICPINRMHMYKREMKSCPWCEADDRYFVMAGINSNDDIDKTRDDWIVDSIGIDSLPECVDINVEDDWMMDNDDAIEIVTNCEAFEGFSKESISELISLLCGVDNQEGENCKKRFYEILTYEYTKKIENENNVSIEQEKQHYLKQYIQSSEDYEIHLIRGRETLYIASLNGIWQLYRGEDYFIEDVKWYNKPNTVAFNIKLYRDDSIIPMFCSFIGKHHVIHEFKRAQPVINEHKFTSDHISNDDWM